MLKVMIDYPNLEEEKKIIRQNIAPEPVQVKPVVGISDIMAAKKVV